jgi:hypothetical protein
VSKQLTSFIVGLTVVGTVTIVLFQTCLRYVYSYDIKDDNVRIVLFRLVPLMTIRISNIREIKESPPMELWKPTFALKFGNRLWGECVVICKKRGFIRRIVITPDNAREFVEDVKQAREQEHQQ